MPGVWLRSFDRTEREALHDVALAEEPTSAASSISGGSALKNDIVSHRPSADSSRHVSRRYAIGQRAGAMICDRLAGRLVKQRIVDTGFELVTRDSA